MLQTLPNLITVGRIVLVPVVIWAITSGNMLLAFWLFVAAGISDASTASLPRSSTPAPSSAPTSTRSPTRRS